MNRPLVIGAAERPVSVNSCMLNRHGAIFGATGTGKTVSLKVLAEQLSSIGVPVFLADVKGDLGSAAVAGELNASLQKRLDRIGCSDYEPESFPVEFFDLFGEEGIPLRATISEMGPLLLSRILGLNETQAGVLNICFSVADESGLLLIDCKDLRAMLNYIDENKASLKAHYGNIAGSSIGAILRALLVLEEQGGSSFIGEPAFDVQDFFRMDNAGRGYFSILSAGRLLQSPTLYATFLLWLFTTLYESLPEVGDPDQPKLVFFFDEAHLLFNDLSPELEHRIEQVVRLSRSKGLSIFFISQSPLDIPDPILAQCGNIIQHGLRAYTPKEQAAVQKIAQNFRQDGSFSVEEAISSLSVGEALVSVLDEKGIPQNVERVLMAPPKSSLRAIDPLRRSQIVNNSSLYEKYAQAIDAKSAYEILEEQAEEKRREAERQTLMEVQKKEEALAQKEEEKKLAQLEKEKRAQEREAARQASRDPGRRFANQVMGSVGRELGRQITRSFLGIFKK